MSIRKLRAGRVPTVTASQFVGEVGTIFWDEGTGTLHLSDGHTPGGVLLSVQTFTSDTVPVNPTDGNLWFDELTGKLYIFFDNTWVDTNPTFVLPVATSNTLGGIKVGPGVNVSNQGILTIDAAGLPISFGDFTADTNNLSVINADEDLNLISNGTGSINIVGKLHVHSTAGGLTDQPVVSVDDNGFTVIRVPSIGPGQTGLLINGDTVVNPASAPQIAGTTFRSIGNDGISNIVAIDANGTGVTAGITARVARGTAASETAVQTGDTIGRFAAVGWGSTNYALDPISGRAASDMRFVATENYTDAHAGSKVQFYTSPTGGTVRTLSAEISPAGINLPNSGSGVKFPDGTIQTTAFNADAISIGDLSISTNNISTINANEDLNLVTNGTGNVNVFGSFMIHTDGLSSTVSFNAAASGLITIKTPDPIITGSSGALNIIGSSNGAFQTVNGTGGMIHLTGNENALVRITVDGYTTSATAPQGSGGYGLLAMRTARGTASSPLHVLANDTLGSLSGLGYVGTGGYSTGQVTGIQFFAAEDFLTSASLGTYTTIRATPVGSNVSKVAARIDAFGITTGQIISTDTTNSTGSSSGAIRTLGGLGVAQDVYVGGSVWADDAVYAPYFGSVGNGSTTVVQGGADGTGTVDVIANLFKVNTTSGSNPAFQVSANSGASTSIFTDLDTGSINPTVLITGNSDSSYQDPQQTGVQLQVVGDVGSPGLIMNDAQGSYAALIQRRYNGSTSSPTAVLSGQIIARLGGLPYTSAGFPALSTARIDMVATENQTGSAQGNQIDFYTIPNGTTTSELTLQVASNGIVSFADFIPYTDNTYDLGSATKRWANIHIGPGTLYITDQTLNTPAAVTVNNGVFNIGGVVQAQLPTILANVISAQTTGGDLDIGQAGDTGKVNVYRGLKFKSDNSIQTVAGIPHTDKGAAGGVATLDGGGKVPASQLPSGAVVYKGAWDASTNTPTLANGTGSAGDEYSVSISGTVNFGAGNIAFTSGDFVIYSGTVWQRIPGAGAVVASFNTRTGPVTLTTGDVTTVLTAGTVNNTMLANSSITTTAGTGITLGGSSVSLGGTLTVTNSGVTSNVAGTGISISGATGAVTITNTGVTAASAGTGISVSSSTGSVTFSNTGVVSNVAGTHITVSGATGNVTIGTDATNLNTASTIVARDASGNFTAGTITAALSGNASTATKLAATKNINGVAFDGSTDITVHTAGTGISITGTTVTNSGVTSNVAGTHITVSGATGAVTIATDATALNSASTLVARDSSGNFAAGTITANLTGNVTGNVSGTAGSVAAANITGATLASNVLSSSLTSVGTLSALAVTATITGSVSGNAGTATKLAATKNINGVAFDGSADITVTAAAGTLTGTTLNSTVVSSSLTSVGTLAALTVTATITGSVSGNAGTATKLATARNINGVAFDGSADVTVHTAGTGISITGTAITNTGVTSAVAGYDVAVSGATGAVTFSSSRTLSTSTTAAAYTLNFNGSGVIAYAPSTNANVTITMANFVAGRTIKMFITFAAGGQTFTVTGLPTGQSFNGSTTFQSIGGAAAPSSMLAEFYCSTTLASGVYLLSVVGGK